MLEQVAAYEPPTLSEAGAFSEVTLGRPNWGFEADWSCVMLC
ncbi:MULTISPECIES: lasso RiPP family leader peptide-containing protein [Actinomadura]|uniref:Lasso RiPP family leader peptide-containing protein n=1 Tax=Actinomadura yumaensis TaxID=111807 RepID=A0ABW2CYW3_9ACTN|nr:lasso RiPP family leader peptide-containing protein [Actinomadura sp. J1-007]MWK38899.1 lasso RiPP family leader peptide-containing protein [Actinomadura sp. J1-007]